MRAISFSFFLGLCATQVEAQTVVETQAEHLVKRTATSAVENYKVVVNGQQAPMRMAIASIAGNMAKELQTLLKEESLDAARTVYIKMYEKGDAPKNQGVRARVTPLDENDLIIDLLVDTRTQLDRGVLSRGILEVLLYRKGLEEVKSISAEQLVNVPPWLTLGVQGAIAWGKENSERKVYEQLLKNPRFFPLEKVFSTTARMEKGFDSADRAFFQAASTALVLAMLNQEGGAEAMSSFIDEVVLFDGELESLIRKHFPDAAIGRNAIQKTWSLQLAEMSAAKLVESLTLLETEQRLLEVLQLSIKAKDGRAQLVPLADAAKLRDLSAKEIVTATDSMRLGVVQLSNRCHPLYRPLLLEYLELCKALGRGHFVTVEKRRLELERLRMVFVEQDERCRDYLDWYQISRARNVTGSFEGYMLLKEELETERELRKYEAIDPYLDRVQFLMGK